MKTHHNEVARLLDRFLRETKISPYSLTELDLLLRSKEIIVKEVKTFYETLSDLFQYREMGLLPTRPECHGEAHELRRRYEGLSYFDSLHAAVGIVGNLELVCYNEKYAEIKELSYGHPGKHTY